MIETFVLHHRTDRGDNWGGFEDRAKRHKEENSLGHSARKGQFEIDQENNIHLQIFIHVCCLTVIFEEFFLFEVRLDIIYKKIFSCPLPFNMSFTKNQNNSGICMAVYTATVYRKKFAPVLFYPLSPSLSNGEFVTGRIPMSHIITLFKNNFV